MICERRATTQCCYTFDIVSKNPNKKEIVDQGGPTRIFRVNTSTFSFVGLIT